ncbi:MAG: HEPN domain-containing protein [Ardenticatenaceae bacterium]|nr:HEPN domain-containing protein [Ardenticatenaceae bacterium]
MKRTKADLVRAWLVKAQKDLLFAQEALKKSEEYTDMACFHAQQSAEKPLEACLVWLEIEFPKTHVLEDLLDLIAQKDTSLEQWREGLRRMTPFAVETRYPEFSLPSWEEAEQAVKTTVEVLDTVKILLPSYCLP